MGNVGQGVEGWQGACRRAWVCACIEVGMGVSRSVPEARAWTDARWESHCRCERMSGSAMLERVKAKMLVRRAMGMTARACE